MADHIALIEMDEGDAFDPRQDFHGVQQTASFARGQIDLRGVAGDDHFGIEALACEHHLHLFDGGVLGFIENNEAVVEGAAAHERERSDFDHVTLDQFLDLFGIDHVEEGVVERAQVRIHFFLQGAGQETEPLACFDGWPGEHNAADALVEISA